MLPTTKNINGVLIDCESPFTLNLVENGEKIDVHFWKPSIKDNGKLFIRISKADKSKFVKACAG